MNEYHPVIHILFVSFGPREGGSIILLIKSISYSCHLDPARGVQQIPYFHFISAQLWRLSPTPPKLGDLLGGEAEIFA